jgi:Mrp family chromosome partitioning ATPase
MALITVMSAKGAPGTTTTAMLLASLWPRPTILVDADPMGGDVALRLPTADGRAMDRERGLLSLLPAARRGLLPEMVAQHTQTALGGQPVVAGLDSPEQSAAVAPLWPTLADTFAQVPGVDVVVDAGQVHQRSPHLALLERSDAVLWVYRPTAWNVLHTRRRLEGLAGLLADTPAVTGVVAVAPAQRSADVESAAQAIVGDWRWVRSYDAVAHDPRAVVMFEGVEVPRPEKTLLARSGRALAQRLGEDVRRVAPLPEIALEEEPGEAAADESAGRSRRGRRRATRGERTP